MRQCGLNDVQRAEVINLELIADEIEGLLRRGKFFHRSDES